MLDRKDKWSVGQWMTSNPHRIAPETSVRTAFLKMRTAGYRHLPVVEDEKLVGMVTDRDLRRPDLSDEPEGWHDFYNLDDDYEVRHVMTSRVESMKPGDSLEKALDLLIERKFGAAPVVDKHARIIGIITTFDLMRAFQSALGEVGEALRQGY
ncbi:MAG: CBS domain-containing protein [bacterium]|nr:CBS domain-containing protein [bacterium]